MGHRIDSINNHILKTIVSHLHNGETTNIELDKLGKRLFRDKYKGTVSVDMMPQRVKGMKVNDCLIFNLDTASQGGSHWVAVYKFGPKTLFYDSFGRTANHIVESRGFEIPTPYLNTELDPEQNQKELNCGQRCMTFLLICKYFGYRLAKRL